MRLKKIFIIAVLSLVMISCCGCNIIQSLSKTILEKSSNPTEVSTEMSTNDIENGTQIITEKATEQTTNIQPTVVPTEVITELPNIDGFQKVSDYYKNMKEFGYDVGECESEADYWVINNPGGDRNVDYVTTVASNSVEVSFGPEKETMSYFKPHFCIDSDDARKANDDIDNELAQYISMVDNFNGKYGQPDFKSLSYEYTIKGDILSLLIEFRGYYNSYKKYFVHNIDLRNGKLVDNNDIYDYFGINEDEVIKKLALAMINEYNYSDKYDNGEKAKTFSEDSIKQSKIYIDKSTGKKYAVCTLYTQIMSGEEVRLIPIE